MGQRFGKAPIEQLVEIWIIGYSDSGKTFIFGVQSKHSNSRIGIIKWHGAWRKYVYETGDSFYDADCLRYIADACESFTQTHMRLKKEGLPNESDRYDYHKSTN